MPEQQQFHDRPLDAYLPIQCPCCGRRRVEGVLRTMDDGRVFVVSVSCEKCHMDEDWDHEAAEPGCSPTLYNGIPEGYVKRDDLP